MTGFVQREFVLCTKPHSLFQCPSLLLLYTPTPKQCAFFFFTSSDVLCGNMLLLLNRLGVTKPSFHFCFDFPSGECAPVFLHSTYQSFFSPLSSFPKLKLFPQFFCVKETITRDIRPSLFSTPVFISQVKPFPHFSSTLDISILFL